MGDASQEEDDRAPGGPTIGLAADMRDQNEFELVQRENGRWLFVSGM